MRASVSFPRGIYRMHEGIAPAEKGVGGLGGPRSDGALYRRQMAAVSLFPANRNKVAASPRQLHYGA